MWRKLILIGACVFLLAAKIDGVKRKNDQKFWELWDSDTPGNEPGKADAGMVEDSEFTIDNEGSGDGDLYINNAHPGHEDDEDFDVASGDRDPDPIILEKPFTIPDDEDDEILGSGSGEESDDIIEVPTVTNNLNKLSKCQSLRDSAVGPWGYKADCEENGDFKRKQCKIDADTKRKSCWCVFVNGSKIGGTMMDYPYEPVCETAEGKENMDSKRTQCRVHAITNLKSCWCVFVNGSMINGTTMEHPDMPDCDTGTNLSGCLFARVQNGQNLPGAVLPKCDSKGDYEPEQCSETQCWCVDKYGNKILGSFVSKPQPTNCGGQTPKPVTKAPIKELPTGKGYTVAPGKKENVIVTDIVLENNNNNFEEYAPVKQDQSIFGQPGFLAAIIAGGVITLLLVVLLVMFIVYRMRKKDEGSYPLDEQKFQNYSYSKAPDKEFYA